MRVTLLGPVRAFDVDREIDLGGPRNRALVARLALDSGRPVAAAALVDDLWGERTPADAANALQSVVSRTRRRLPDGALRSTPAGYVLDAEVDSSTFTALVSEGEVEAALALWQGPALADVRDLPFADRHAGSLEEARLAALEQHLGSRSPDAALVTELAGLVRDHPYRDGFWVPYLRALVAVGRSSEALTAYQGLREQLADELGTDPSAVLQALHEQILRGEVAPARSSSPRGARRERLPVSLTSFVGRDEAVAELGEAVREHRLVTVLGPGGAGKTRLAIEAARAGRDRFGDVWLVELAPVTAPEDVVPAVLAGLGLLEVSVLERSGTGPRTDPRHDARRRLLDAVRDAEGLLVLDNCEHLVDEAAAVAEAVLARAPRLRVLATSREPLRLIGELAYPLGPLAIPPQGASVEEAAGFSAVRLFVERARAADRGFALSDTTVGAVREICARLDGQPLALELAAARLRTMSVEQVAARLSDRFRLLTGGSRTALPRHRTLRAVVEWSWDLLDARERDLAERVAVFPSGVTPAGASAVLDGAPDCADLLESLADKSLLEPIRGTGRYRMLETLREYGVDRLVERGIADTVRSAHLDHHLALAEELAEHIRDERQMAAVAVVDAERGNLTAALRYAVESADRPRAARMTMALAWYWSIRNQHLEADGWARAVRALPGRAAPSAEIACAALDALGALVLRREGEDWRAYVEEILATWDEYHPVDSFSLLALATLQYHGLTGDRVLPEPPDPWTRSMVLLMHLVLLENAGRLHEEPDLLTEAIEGFRSCGDLWGLATALGARGMSEAADGEFEKALATWSQALPLLERLGAEEDVAFSQLRVLALRLATAAPDDLPVLRSELEADLASARRRGDGPRVALCLMGRGQVEHLLGDDAASAATFREILAGLDAVVAFGSGQFEAMIRASLAGAVAGTGDLATACAELDVAAKVAVGVQDMPVVALVAAVSARIAHLAGDDTGAVRLLAAARVIRGREDRSNRDAEDLAATLRERLGEKAFQDAYDTGAALTRPDAIGLVVRAPGTGPVAGQALRR